MSLVRIGFASLLALLAVAVVVGHGLLIRNHQELSILDHVVAFGAMLLFGASSFYCFRSRAYWDTQLSCPHCRKSGSLQLTPLGQPRVSALAWVFTGIIGALL